jgi:hypothetical protein
LEATPPRGLGRGVEFASFVAALIAEGDSPSDRMALTSLAGSKVQPIAAFAAIKVAIAAMRAPS